jgi:hypothetical protein
MAKFYSIVSRIPPMVEKLPRAVAAAKDSAGNPVDPSPRSVSRAARVDDNGKDELNFEEIADQRDEILLNVVML